MCTWILSENSAFWNISNLGVWQSSIALDIDFNSDMDFEDIEIFGSSYK